MKTNIKKAMQGVEVAKKAVEKAEKDCLNAISECHDVVLGIDFTGYIPKEIPEEVINEVSSKLPQDVSGEKLAYEVACYYWSVRCLADAGYVPAERAIKEAQEVLRNAKEVLNTKQEALDSLYLQNV